MAYMDSRVRLAFGFCLDFFHSENDACKLELFPPVVWTSVGPLVEGTRCSLVHSGAAASRVEHVS